MEIVHAQNKYELLSKIKNLDGCSEVYLSMRPTKEIIDNLLQNCPNVKRVLCPKSLYPQVAKKVFRELREKGVELDPGTFRVGRPKKYDKSQVRTIIDERQMGKSARLISQERDIPLRTVYFYLKQGV